MKKNKGGWGGGDYVLPLRRVREGLLEGERFIEDLPFSQTFYTWPLKMERFRPCLYGEKLPREKGSAS